MGSRGGWLASGYFLKSNRDRGIQIPQPGKYTRNINSLPQLLTHDADETADSLPVTDMQNDR
jgi:hypothetical protein